MILKPRTLAISITVSFVLVLTTITEAYRPTSVTGIIFWISFLVFAFCCNHLSKNDDYYRNYLDEDL